MLYPLSQTAQDKTFILLTNFSHLCSASFWILHHFGSPSSVQCKASALLGHLFCTTSSYYLQPTQMLIMSITLRYVKVGTELPQFLNSLIIFFALILHSKLNCKHIQRTHSHLLFSVYLQPLLLIKIIDNTLLYMLIIYQVQNQAMRIY